MGLLLWELASLRSRRCAANIAPPPPGYPPSRCARPLALGPFPPVPPPPPHLGLRSRFGGVGGSEALELLAPPLWC